MDNFQKHNNYVTATGWLRIPVPGHHFYIPIPFPTLGLLFYPEDGSSRFCGNVGYYLTDYTA
jgi:hypothetical protein